MGDTVLRVSHFCNGSAERPQARCIESWRHLRERKGEGRGSRRRSRAKLIVFFKIGMCSFRRGWRGMPTHVTDVCAALCCHCLSSSQPKMAKQTVFSLRERREIRRARDCKSSVTLSFLCCHRLRSVK